MKLKNIRKKIRRLEARLQEGAKKLAKLKQKLAATTTSDARKQKSAARAGQSRQTGKSARATRKKRRGLVAKPEVKPPGAKKRTKEKRKLNLSPERRAQLAAAMKARWAAKRATAEANPQNASRDS